MKKAFDDSEKALLAEKKFNHQVLRKMRKFKLEDFEHYSLFTFFNDFIILIPGADTPCTAHNFDRMKNFARAQSSVYNALPDSTLKYRASSSSAEENEGIIATTLDTNTKAITLSEDGIKGSGRSTIRKFRWGSTWDLEVRTSPPGR
ncbi:uncharacterized protein B0J16DRAFT_369855 [Fusarium flagelliforme]|uniref:uncharacterized protein n=1 Tax=Fusarium flagelliforme TaxID=2675880 RepID=UPI001E8D2AE9|nr:uncharacterized protein B0J16DRAFT_369855 [Fusarium flagelliforme]KAH7193780.1 hypothetical protein B0J16DRAFT_369855 [Fusarium flagelliforme]